MLPRVRKSCQTIGKCFPAPGSPVRPSESASPRQEVLSDHRKVLPRARKSCQTIGKCFPAPGSPVRPSESASTRQEVLSDHRKVLPRVRKPCQTIGKCFPAPGSPVRSFYNDQPTFALRNSDCFARFPGLFRLEVLDCRSM